MLCFHDCVRRPVFIDIERVRFLVNDERSLWVDKWQCIIFVGSDKLGDIIEFSFCISVAYYVWLRYSHSVGDESIDSIVNCHSEPIDHSVSLALSI